VIHKQTEHGIDDKLIELVQLGNNLNFKINVRNAGDMIMQECYGCGSTVPLSEFADHQEGHLVDHISREVNKAVDKIKIDGPATKKQKTEDKAVVIIKPPCPWDKSV